MTDSNLIIEEDHRDEGYVILKLNNGPYNKINLEFLIKFNNLLDKLEEDSSISGIIITSNVPEKFSHGLDINELYDPKEDRLAKFWTALQDVWIKLYGSKKTIFTAINGHAAAGGCMLALASDYRLMSQGPYKIGYGETCFGMAVPKWFADNMINIIGFRETEKALITGKLFSPEEALAVKLVDEVVHPNELLSKAQLKMAEWCKIPAIPRALTKLSLRKETISKLVSSREEELKVVSMTLSNELMKQNLKRFLDNPNWTLLI